MFKPLMILALHIGLAAFCFAQNGQLTGDISSKSNAFVPGEDFEETNLLGYVYAFSTSDSVLTIQDMLSKKPDFRLVEREVPHFGSDKRYHWIRTDIKNGGLQYLQLVSYLHLNELADLCFYVVDDKKRIIYQQEHLSQRTYISKKPIPTRYFAFPVNLPAGTKTTIYWRLYGGGNSVVAPVRLYTKKSFDSFQRLYDSFAFLCLGVIISAFLLSSALFFVTRLTVLFHYAGYSLFYFLICISNDGIVLQYFHIDPFEVAIGTRLIITGFLIFFLLQFSKYFLESPKLLWWPFIKLSDWLSYTLPAFGLTIAIFSLDARFSSLFFLLSTLAMILLLAMMLVGMVHRKREAFFYFIAAGPFFLSSVWYGLIIVFGVASTWFYYMSVLVIPIVEMVVLGIELGNKIIRERDKYFDGLNTLQRELTSSILKTQELERSRVAADLHDDVGGTLAAIRLKFASMKRNLHLKESLGQPSLEVVDDIEPLIYKSSQDLRRISQNLMPPEFERIGMLASIQHVVDSMPDLVPHFTFLTAGKQRTMSPEKELAIYRIATETLRSIARREQVRRGSLQILYFDEGLRIVVEADVEIDSISETEKMIQNDLSGSSLLATHLAGNFVLEVSHAGTLAIVEVPY